MVFSSSAAINGSGSTSSTKSSPISFTNLSTVKLDNANFLVWRKHVLSAVRGHCLLGFLTGDSVPPQIASVGDQSDSVCQEFSEWEQQDQLLVSWLLSTMSENIMSRVIKCETTSSVWAVLETYFASQARAKVTQYKVLLRSTKKESLSMNDYLMKIRGIVDFLELVGHEVSDKEHVDAIFNGLPDDYDNFVCNFDLKDRIPTVDETESLLLVQEARVDMRLKDREKYLTWIV